MSLVTVESCSLCGQYLDNQKHLGNSKVDMTAANGNSSFKTYSVVDETWFFAVDKDRFELYSL